MSKKEVQMWVHPEFKKELKSDAAKSGMSILELTKALADKKISISYQNKRSDDEHEKF
jgi:hypothetical protein